MQERQRVGFSHTQTRVTGQDLQPGPSPFTKRIFFGTRTHPYGPRRLHKSRWAVILQGPFCGPIKKICLPDIDLLNNQTRGEKEHSRKPIIFSATNIFEQSETNKTHYFLSNQQIGNPFFFITLFSHIKSKNNN